MSEEQKKEEIRALLGEKVQAAEDGNLLSLLSIEADATNAQIQKAFFDLAKLIHPDKLIKFGVNDMKREATTVFKALSEAYNTMLDTSRRDAYLATLNAPSSAAAEAVQRSDEDLLSSNAADLNVNKSEAAKIFSHKGALLLKKGDYAKAEEFYRKAHTAEPENSRYELNLGWAILQNPNTEKTTRLNGAKEHLEASIKNEPENADAHYYMARYYKEVGRMAECRKHLESAVQFRRNYIEAKRELRLIDMRSNKNKNNPNPAQAQKSDDDGGNWFTNLFKRKS